MKQVNLRMKTFVAGLVMVAVSWLCAPRAEADTNFFSNLGQSLNDFYPIQATTILVASDFLTDGSARTITAAELLLRNSDFVDHNLTFSIFTDDGSGEPGSLVGSFDPFLVSPGDNYTTNSTTSAGINLAANTVYWAVLQINEAADDGALDWAGTGSDATDAGSVYFTIPSTAVKNSINSGATWSDFESLASNMQFSLSGPVAVPEPVSVALVGLGLGLLVTRRRRA